MTQKRGNALLAELMVVALFFALAAMVLAQVFAAADEQSRRAEVLDEALAAGQELQEQLAGRDDPAAFLAERGYALSDAWTKDFGAFSLRVELTEEPHASGVLRAGSILAECGDETLLELPFADYLAQEVTP